MAKHKDFTIATDVRVYLCDPQSPWQRGANENMNLLLLQYFPRGTDLSSISQERTFKAWSQDRLQMKGLRARLIERAAFYRFPHRVYFVDSVRQSWKSQVQPKYGQ